MSTININARDHKEWVIPNHRKNKGPIFLWSLLWIPETQQQEDGEEQLSARMHHIQL